MKLMTLTLLCVVLAAHGTLHAQQPLAATKENKQQKPYLFSSLPDQFEVASAELSKLFTAEPDNSVSAQLSSKFKIVGFVTDKSQHTPGTLSINVRLRNYDNALFNATIRLQADNSTSIQGRIIHPKYADVLELYKEKDKYYFKKVLQRLYMTD